MIDIFDTENLVSATEAIEILGVSKATFHRYKKSHKHKSLLRPTAYSPAKHLYIKRNLRMFIEANARDSGAIMH